VQLASLYEAWAVGDYGVILHWVDPNRAELVKRVCLPVIMRP